MKIHGTNYSEEIDRRMKCILHPSSNITRLPWSFHIFVHSIISYGIEIYGNTFKTYLSTIEKTVNKILRILKCKRRREIHVVDLYRAYNTLPVSSLFKLYILKFVHALACGSYRGIKLVEHAMKVLERVIERRVRNIGKIDSMQKMEN